MKKGRGGVLGRTAPSGPARKTDGARIAVGALVALAALGIAGAGLWFARPQSQRRGATGQPVGLPTKADPSLGIIDVGVATGYAGTQLIDTGPVNYDYIGKNWAYVGRAKDWYTK